MHKKIIDVKPCLSKILKERGLTQMQFSEMCGLSQVSISRFDRSRQHLDLNLFIIAKALNLKIEDLFEVIEE